MCLLCIVWMVLLVFVEISMLFYFVCGLLLCWLLKCVMMWLFIGYGSLLWVELNVLL